MTIGKKNRLRGGIGHVGDTKGPLGKRFNMLGGTESGIYDPDRGLGYPTTTTTSTTPSPTTSTTV